MDWLNYHHLQYFWVVAECGSVRKAAEKLHVTPATVSVQIRDLERALGVLLGVGGYRALRALGGVAVPAAIYLALNAGPGGAPQGWPTPAATDIAFALAALSLVAPRLPPTLRIFLLTLAIADDLALQAAAGREVPQRQYVQCRRRDCFACPRHA